MRPVDEPPIQTNRGQATMLDKFGAINQHHHLGDQ